MQLTELVDRVEEKTELAIFMSEVVKQFKIADTRKFDKTITTEDRLNALRWINLREYLLSLSFKSVM